MAIALANLVEQRQWIMVVHEAHRLALIQSFESAKDSRMAKAFGNATGVKTIHRLVQYKGRVHSIPWVAPRTRCEESDESFDCMAKG
jgi:hypothetical protein